MPPTSPEHASVRPPHPLAVELIAVLGAGGARVIDFASGSGRNARALRAAGFEVAEIGDADATAADDRTHQRQLCRGTLHSRVAPRHRRGHRRFGRSDRGQTRAGGTALRDASARFATRDSRRVWRSSVSSTLRWTATSAASPTPFSTNPGFARFSRGGLRWSPSKSAMPTKSPAIGRIERNRFGAAPTGSSTRASATDSSNYRYRAPSPDVAAAWRQNLELLCH